MHCLSFINADLPSIFVDCFADEGIKIRRVIYATQIESKGDHEGSIPGLPQEKL